MTLLIHEQDQSLRSYANSTLKALISTPDILWLDKERLRVLPIARPLVLCIAGMGCQDLRTVENCPKSLKSLAGVEPDPWQTVFKDNRINAHHLRLLEMQAARLAVE